MAKVLVIGVDTMLGANLALVFGQHADCVGLYHQQAVEPADCLSIACNLSCADSLTSTIRTLAPQRIVYCGPTSRSAWDPASADWTEARVVRAIADEVVAQQAALTVVSTDAVFAGPRLFHDETSPHVAQTPPASAARAVEDAVRDAKALVVRTHAYGWSPLCDEANFAEQLAHDLREGEATSLDGVRYATPILATDLAELLVRAHHLDLRGTYHITGAERANPDRFARELRLALGIDCPTSTGQSAPPPAIVSETSLNTRRARRDLARPMPLLREGLERFAAQAVNGHLDRLRQGSRIADLKPVAA